MSIDGKIDFTIFSDSDGFMKFNCSNCDRDFKLSINEVEAFDGDELNCPYCGIRANMNTFASHELVEKQKETAIQYAQYAFQEMLKDVARKSKTITYKTKTHYSAPDSITIQTEESIESAHKCKKCGNTTKLLNVAKSEKGYCAYCGEII